MKFRVHLYVVVRVERELDAVTAEEAASTAFTNDDDLYRRFDQPGQEYSESIEEVCLVDPLTDETDRKGRLLPDYENSREYRVSQERQADGTWANVARQEVSHP